MVALHHKRNVGCAMVLQGIVFASKKRAVDADMPSEDSQPLFSEHSNAHST